MCIRDRLDAVELIPAVVRDQTLDKERLIRVCDGASKGEHRKNQDEALASAQDTEDTILFLYNRYYARLALGVLNGQQWWQAGAQGKGSSNLLS